MEQTELTMSSSGEAVMAFPLRNGLVNLELAAGAKTGISLIQCVEAGSILVVWDATDSDTIACVEGDSFSVYGAVSVAVSSGKFHFAT